MVSILLTNENYFCNLLSVVASNGSDYICNCLFKKFTEFERELKRVKHYHLPTEYHYDVEKGNSILSLVEAELDMDTGAVESGSRGDADVEMFSESTSDSDVEMAS